MNSVNPAGLTQFNPTALSAYLALRWVPFDDAPWAGELRPCEVTVPPPDRDVTTSEEILAELRDAMAAYAARGAAGLLLSSGIDSAILAALLPKGTRAYTIHFDAPGATDEATVARLYANRARLAHDVVTVRWNDYEKLLDPLMLHKRAPLHPVEVGLCKAALRAAADGIRTLIVGNGADSTFGGLDKLLSRDWTFDEFVNRYTFVRPEDVLREPASVVHAFEPHRRGAGIDVAGFLKVVHGTGVTQAFENALAAGGCRIAAPYEALRLTAPLDLNRIRRGESKYLLRSIFSRLYPDLPMPDKIAFARPMDSWMARWHGPTRREFKQGAQAPTLNGEQRWQVYCLERFLNLLEASRA